MHPATAAYFPLIARHRPICLPLNERIAHLKALAEQAVRDNDNGTASSVFNQAALLASDLGLPDLARAWCHQHANAYLRAVPRTGMDAIRAIEPLVNLARLQIRDGNGNNAQQLLMGLYTAVSTRYPASIGGITVPANLTETNDDHAEVTGWLWRVVIAEGARALTTAGRWQDALDHVQRHHGVGSRMLDGRQVAILAASHRGDHDTAQQLLADTAPGEAWENAVTAALRLLVRPSTQRSTAQQDTAYIRAAEVPWHDNHAVFHTRLLLANIDGGSPPIIGAHVEKLAGRITALGHGYCARDILAHPVVLGRLEARTRARLEKARDACALGSRHLSVAHRRLVSVALEESLTVIGRAVDAPR